VALEWRPRIRDESPKVRRGAVDTTGMRQELHACPKCRRISFAAGASARSLCDKCAGRTEADTFLDDVQTVPRIAIPLRWHDVKAAG
jgi:ribosomal protein S27AE